MYLVRVGLGCLEINPWAENAVLIERVDLCSSRGLDCWMTEQQARDLAGQVKGRGSDYSYRLKMLSPLLGIFCGGKVE